MNKEDDPISVYRDVVSILEKNLKYLVSVNLDSSTEQAYKRIIGYLKDREDNEIVGILGVRKSGGRRSKIAKDPQLSDEEISQLDGRDVLKIVSSNEVTRKFLERLAGVRFGVSVGALSALRNRTAVVEKLRVMVDHENTHDAISRVLKSKQSN